MILRATAKKEAMIAEAEGQAQATERLYAAQAKGIEMIKNSDPSLEFLTLKRVMKHCRRWRMARRPS